MATAVGLSCLNALTLCPALCAVWLRPANGDRSTKSLNARVRMAYYVSYNVMLGKCKHGLLFLFRRCWLLVGIGDKRSRIGIFGTYHQDRLCAAGGYGYAVPEYHRLARQHAGADTQGGTIGGLHPCLPAGGGILRTCHRQRHLGGTRRVLRIRIHSALPLGQAQARGTFRSRCGDPLEQGFCRQHQGRASVLFPAGDDTRLWHRNPVILVTVKRPILRSERRYRPYADTRAGLSDWNGKSLTLYFGQRKSFRWFNATQYCS